LSEEEDKETKELYEKFFKDFKAFGSCCGSSTGGETVKIKDEEIQKLGEDEVKTIVREGYTKVAKDKGLSDVSSCCGTGNTELAEKISKNIGYSEEELKSIPEEANLGLGCGNPTALASLKEGEVVLDLGSGAGLDCFLAANKVGKAGRVIGVDMTPEMLDRARKNAKKANYNNVEFRLGEIGNLPVADNSVDVIISNCVINLSPNKQRVFNEIFRVLKPGGRFMISDIALLKDLPDFIRKSLDAYIGCVAGAILKNDYLDAIRNAGLRDVSVVSEATFPIEFITNDPTVQTMIKKFQIKEETLSEIASSVVSIKVEGYK
jgi:arsenite methyltransferase